MTRILLTGAAGFIGGAIRDRLETAGHEVVPVDLMLPEAHRDLEPPTGVHRLDVVDAASWGHLLRGVDAVCHQAAMVGAGVTPSDLPLYARHNDLGTAALLAAMHEAGLSRLVLASSMVVYGEGRYVCADHGQVVPPPRSTADLDAGRFESVCPGCGRELGWASVGEDARLEPRSSYAASKLAQEHYAVAWARQADACAVALRYHNVYGPRMPRDTPYSGVAAMFRSSLERGEAPRVYEDGGQMRDFVHVDDVARANVLALEALVSGDLVDRGDVVPLNVCSGSPVSILEVARRIAAGREGGPEPAVTGQYRLGDVRHVVAAPDRARDLLGFTAAVAPAEGLREFATVPLRA